MVVPPILLLQWELWLRSVTDLRTGKPLTVCVYAGTPAQRKDLDLNADFIVVSYGLLKNDFERLHDHFSARRLGIISDEATAIKNTESQTHKAVSLIAEGRPLMLLTGTPINKPGDAYAYLKLIVPGVYRNRRQFDRLHVEEKDEYDKVTSWMNLDLLASNMKVQTSRILRREVRKDLPAVVYTTKDYRLDPAHLALYRQIAQERLVEFEDGREIDAISASALRSALQQIVINWGEFDGNPERRPAGLELAEEILEELGDKKLVIVANFRRTNAYLLQALSVYNPRAIYGDVSPANKQLALRDFIGRESCRVLLVQPQSAGFGVDGLQRVCSDILFLEAPTTPSPFQQTIARLDRDGQEDVVHCRVGVAQGTVQVGMFRDLMVNDAVANKVQGGFKDLKEMIYGG